MARRFASHSFRRALRTARSGVAAGFDMNTPNEIAVAHLCAPAEAGGLETIVRQLARGQQRAGMRVVVLSVVDPSAGPEHPFVRALVGDGVDARGLPIPSRGYLLERRRTRAELERFRPAVVHLHGYRVELVDAPVARALGAAVVSTVHGFTGGDWKNRLYEIAQRRALRRLHAVVAVSEPMRRLLAESGIPAERLHLVPNVLLGFHPLTRDEARATLGIQPGRRVIGWVGRLSHEKGADVFIQAFAKLPDPGVEALIVGDGPERAPLEALARRLGIADRLIFAGQIPEAGRLVPAFDLVVLSSRTEGTPMVLLEALQAGMGVVATEVGGIPAAANGRASLVRPEDPAGLSVAIAAALRGSPRQSTSPASALDDGGSWIGRYRAVYHAAQTVRNREIGFS